MEKLQIFYSLLTNARGNLENRTNALPVGFEVIYKRFLLGMASMASGKQSKHNNSAG